MKAVILAAGRGKRLMPLTENVPKCMVKYKKKEIIDYILEGFRANNITNISLVKGYKAELLKKKGTKEYINYFYESTNMVYSFFCSRNEWDDDLIISYSDIIYPSSYINLLVESQSDISVIIDKDWRKLWEKRMDDPLQDAETLKLDKDNNIIEIGKKPKNYDEISGQYVGLLKIKKDTLSKIKDFYFSLDENAVYDGQSLKNIYMTSFLQLIIEKLTPIKAIIVHGGWIEIDTINDLKRLSK